MTSVARPFVGAVVVIVVVACCRSGSTFTTAWLSSPRGRRWCSGVVVVVARIVGIVAITAAIGRRILAPRPKWAGVLTTTMQ